MSTYLSFKILKVILNVRMTIAIKGLQKQQERLQHFLFFGKIQQTFDASKNKTTRFFFMVRLAQVRKT